MNTAIGSIVSTLEDLGDPPNVPPDRALDACGSIAAVILAGGALLTIGRLLKVW